MVQKNELEVPVPAAKLVHHLFQFAAAFLFGHTKSASGAAPPARTTRDAIRFETRGNHGISFERLLIKIGALLAAFIKTVAADWPKVSGWSGLNFREPSQRIEADGQNGWL